MKRKTTERRDPAVGVVDADPGERIALQELLERGGARVVAYESAERLLEHRGAIRLDCLIVDLTLPGISGLELLRRLRKSRDQLPVILLAQGSDVRTAVEAMLAGAVDFIEKPYTNATVLKRVRRLLHDPRPIAGS